MGCRIRVDLIRATSGGECNQPRMSSPTRTTRGVVVKEEVTSEYVSRFFSPKVLLTRDKRAEALWRPEAKSKEAICKRDIQPATQQSGMVIGIHCGEPVEIKHEWFSRPDSRGSYERSEKSSRGDDVGPLMAPEFVNSRIKLDAIAGCNDENDVTEEVISLIKLEDEDIKVEEEYDSDPLADSPLRRESFAMLDPGRVQGNGSLATALRDRPTFAVPVQPNRTLPLRPAPPVPTRSPTVLRCSNSTAAATIVNVINANNDTGNDVDNGVKDCDFKRGSKTTNGREDKGKVRIQSDGSSICLFKSVEDNEETDCVVDVTERQNAKRCMQMNCNVSSSVLETTNGKRKSHTRNLDETNSSSESNECRIVTNQKKRRSIDSLNEVIDVEAQSPKKCEKSSDAVSHSSSSNSNAIKENGKIPPLRLKKIAQQVPGDSDVVMMNENFSSQIETSKYRIVTGSTPIPIVTSSVNSSPSPTCSTSPVATASTTTIAYLSRPSWTSPTTTTTTTPFLPSSAKSIQITIPSMPELGIQECRIDHIDLTPEPMVVQQNTGQDEHQPWVLQNSFNWSKTINQRRMNGTYQSSSPISVMIPVSRLTGTLHTPDSTSRIVQSHPQPNVILGNQPSKNENNEVPSTTSSNAEVIQLSENETSPSPMDTDEVQEHRENTEFGEYQEKPHEDEPLRSRRHRLKVKLHELRSKAIELRQKMQTSNFTADSPRRARLQQVMAEYEKQIEQLSNMLNSSNCGTNNEVVETVEENCKFHIEHILEEEKKVVTQKSPTPDPPKLSPRSPPDYLTPKSPSDLRNSPPVLPRVCLTIPVNLESSQESSTRSTVETKMIEIEDMPADIVKSDNTLEDSQMEAGIIMDNSLSASGEPEKLMSVREVETFQDAGRGRGKGRSRSRSRSRSSSSGLGETSRTFTSFLIDDRVCAPTPSVIQRQMSSVFPKDAGSRAPPNSPREALMPTSVASWSDSLADLVVNQAQIPRTSAEDVDKNPMSVEGHPLNLTMRDYEREDKRRKKRVKKKPEEPPVSPRVLSFPQYNFAENGTSPTYPGRLPSNAIKCLNPRVPDVQGKTTLLRENHKSMDYYSMVMGRVDDGRSLTNTMQNQAYPTSFEHSVIRPVDYETLRGERTSSSISTSTVPNRVPTPSYYATSVALPRTYVNPTDAQNLHRVSENTVLEQTNARDSGQALGSNRQSSSPLTVVPGPTTMVGSSAQMNPCSRLSGEDAARCPPNVQTIERRELPEQFPATLGNWTTRTAKKQTTVKAKKKYELPPSATAENPQATFRMPKSNVYKTTTMPNDVPAGSNFLVGNVLLPGWKDGRWLEQQPPHLMHQIAAMGTPPTTIPAVPPTTGRPGFCPPMPVGRFYTGDYPIDPYAVFGYHTACPYGPTFQYPRLQPLPGLSSSQRVSMDALGAATHFSPTLPNEKSSTHPIPPQRSFLTEVLRHPSSHPSASYQRRNPIEYVQNVTEGQPQFPQVYRDRLLNQLGRIPEGGEVPSASTVTTYERLPVTIPAVSPTSELMRNRQFYKNGYSHTLRPTTVNVSNSGPVASTPSQSSSTGISANHPGSPRVNRQTKSHGFDRNCQTPHLGKVNRSPNTLRSLRCSNCGANGSRFECLGCESAFYCNETCQTLHWNVHVSQCPKIMPKLKKVG